MAVGYRIHNRHKPVWGSTVLVKHPGDTKTGRLPKEYVFRLDTNGDIIVSSTIWARLKEIEAAGFDHGFSFVNEVPNPPTINTGDLGDLNRRVFKHTSQGINEVEKNALQNIVPKGFKPKGTSTLTNR